MGTAPPPAPPDDAQPSPPEHVRVPDVLIAHGYRRVVTTARQEFEHTARQLHEHAGQAVTHAATLAAVDHLAFLATLDAAEKSGA